MASEHRQLPDDQSTPSRSCVHQAGQGFRFSSDQVQIPVASMSPKDQPTAPLRYDQPGSSSDRYGSAPAGRYLWQGQLKRRKYNARPQAGELLQHHPVLSRYRMRLLRRRSDWHDFRFRAASPRDKAGGQPVCAVLVQPGPSCG
ncbi:hypothetical protein D3C80_1676830 [compost metagenome]